MNHHHERNHCGVCCVVVDDWKNIVVLLVLQGSTDCTKFNLLLVLVEHVQTTGASPTNNLQVGVMCTGYLQSQYAKVAIQ